MYFTYTYRLLFIALFDLRSHPVAMVLLLRKKRGKKPGMRRAYFRSGPLPDRSSSGHFRSKCSTRADIAPLPVAHAQNILPMLVTDVTSGHVTDVLPVTSLPVT